MNTLCPERGSFKNIHKVRPQFHPTLSIKVGMGSHQKNFNYSNYSNHYVPIPIPREKTFNYSIPRDFIHDDDLEEIMIHTPKTPPRPSSRPSSQVQQRDIKNIPTNIPTTIIIGNIKFPLSVFIILSLLLSILAGGAIFVHEKYSDIDCITSYSGISFGYIKWLYIYGWTNIGIISIMIWLFIISKCTDVKLDTLKLNFLRLGYLFQFSWYIIGTILYFTEINNSCSPKDVLYDFGMALFICQTIVFGTIILQDRRN